MENGIYDRKYLLGPENSSRAGLQSRGEGGRGRQRVEVLGLDAAADGEDRDVLVGEVGLAVASPSVRLLIQHIYRINY